MPFIKEEVLFCHRNSSWLGGVCDCSVYTSTVLLKKPDFGHQNSLVYSRPQVGPQALFASRKVRLQILEIQRTLIYSLCRVKPISKLPRFLYKLIRLRSILSERMSKWITPYIHDHYNQTPVQALGLSKLRSE